MKQILTIILLFTTSILFAQKEKVNWLTFDQLEQKLATQPKKVMIHFYADWCDYCKKMENVVYTKPEIVKELNTNYYALKFNVESQDTVKIGNKTFINSNVGKKRNAYHELAEILASQKDQPLTLPAVIFFNQAFEIEKRMFRYIAPKELLRLLQD